MYPPIFELCSADANVQTNIGTSPCRLYPWGEAPQGVAKPYAVWQNIGGGPENYINQVPDTDLFILQLDVYDTTPSGARDAAQALRDVIEQHAHITSFGGDGQDPDTNNYRWRATINWIVDRDTVS